MTRTNLSKEPVSCLGPLHCFLCELLYFVFMTGVLTSSVFFCYFSSVERPYTRSADSPGQMIFVESDKFISVGPRQKESLSSVWIDPYIRFEKV